MQHQVLKDIAERVKLIEPQLEEARGLILALEEAGELNAASEMRTELRESEQRLMMWQAMLKARGLDKV